MPCQDQFGDVLEEEAAEVEVAPRPGASVVVEFDHDEINAVFGAVRDGEKTTAFIRAAVFALVAERAAEARATALPEAGS